MTRMIRNLAALLCTLATILDRWVADIDQALRALRAIGADVVETATATVDAATATVNATAKAVRSIRLNTSITYTDRSGARPRTATAASASLTRSGASIVVMGRTLLDTRAIGAALVTTLRAIGADVALVGRSTSAAIGRSVRSEGAADALAMGGAMVRAVLVAVAVWSVPPFLLACAAR